VKSRYVSFFVEPEQDARVVHSVDEDLVPRLSALENFRGLLVIKTGRGRRSEVVAISLWSDDLQDSEAASQKLLDDVRAAGFRPALQEFDIVRVMMRDADGNVCLDSA